MYSLLHVRRQISPQQNQTSDPHPREQTNPPTGEDGGQEGGGGKEGRVGKEKRVGEVLNVEPFLVRF